MLRRLAIAAVAGLALTACGASGSSGSSSESLTASPAPGDPASPFPAIEVRDVTADRTVALDSFLPSDRPLLVWFWAPH